MNKIIQGDCLEELKKLEDNTIDAVVTDPPYELGFMGKSWDNTGIANNPLMWKECLRVLKPGGYLISFGGTRTYHRMAIAIEDAGFEVRDMIEWVYGSGFPKSLNIGKAVDKLQGNEREVVGIEDKHSHIDGVMGGDRKNGGGVGYKGGIIEHTKGTSEWEGWGTALKPAHEPICMARKPLAEKTVAKNCLKWGTGGINIDESRVGTGGDYTVHNAGISGSERYQWNKGEQKESSKEYTTTLGRFPANLIHDNSEEVRECFPENSGANGTKSGKYKASNNINLGGGYVEEQERDKGNASRFFKSIIYQAKASKSERNRGCEGLEEKLSGAYEFRNRESGKGQFDGQTNTLKANNHPTVKPIALMEYLIKMVTKEGQTVLDPFAGSGTSGIACKNLNRNYILIEKEPEYIEIIKKRIQ